LQLIDWQKEELWILETCSYWSRVPIVLEIRHAAAV
jgi:hypothetical protein